MEAAPWLSTIWKEADYFSVKATVKRIDRLRRPSHLKRPSTGPNFHLMRQRSKPRANGGPARFELGRYIVVDPLICHGKPTFKGTRIMVWQVLDDVADGRSWDFICNVRWGGRIPLAAIAEAVRLAQHALLDKRGRLTDAAFKGSALAAA